MHFRTAIACAVILLGSAATSGAQTVSLQFDNGNVTVNAQNASIRTILTEWARLGGTRIVNHERLGGAPVNLELINVPEQRALDVLLRSAAGYVVTARQGSTGASMIGGLVILPTTSAPRTPAAITFGAATPSPGPTFDDPRDDQPPAAAARPNAATGSGSPFSVTPGPVIGGPQVIRVGPGATAQFTLGTPADTVPPTTTPATTQAPPLPSPRPSNMPQVLPGTSRPGEITPVPQQQPNQR
jgi:hypothetical protein